MESKNYKWDPAHEFVIDAAIALGRPLLVRGEPGVGKSSLARAAAEKLKRTFISEVVTARTEPNDLLWQFDGVKRLGDAQIECALPEAQRDSSRLDKSNYLIPGALWWAFQPEQAADFYDRCSGSCYPSLNYNIKNPVNKGGWVVLIDEIDKADSDVPNSLLEAFAEGQFKVPYLDESVSIQDGITDQEKIPNPLIIITTNEERELPKAFLRRCFVLHMGIPEIEDDAEKWLIERAKAHDASDDLPLSKIAKIVLEDRKNSSGRYKPGLGEYLDFVSTFANKKPSEKMSKKEEGKFFEIIKSFTLNKDAS
ncbi:AAA family ATPase [Maridesulfovibrio frigidus]|uniref:AAA family ATPase n=1 Tax=Maridesulfovibrio frigidus TaxID=340956 RepID=UPI0006911D45|nr:MoxR family ATPase [Maridesulfovibrio frigidus]